jgi:phage shock protein PspC (stress-responsive transcriptional regulator)
MASPGSIIARDDTLLGICFALGQDFGFNPVYLRVLLALGVLWSLPTAIGAYLGLGALVALSRWAAPDPLGGEAEPASASECADEPCEELKLAA